MVWTRQVLPETCLDRTVDSGVEPVDSPAQQSPETRSRTTNEVTLWIARTGVPGRWRPPDAGEVRTKARRIHKVQWVLPYIQVMVLLLQRARIF